MIRFLIKGLLRDRSRSLFPSLMVSAGAFLTVLLHSYMNGVIGDVVDASARFDTGHVKIVSRAYHDLADQMPNDLALLGVDHLLNQVGSAFPEVIWTPRIRFGGLLDIPGPEGETRSQGPVLGLGIDRLQPESPEWTILNLKRALVRGRLPVAPQEMVISDGFARKLGVDLNDSATLMSSTMHGSMAMVNFKIVGTIRFGMTALDRNTMVADLGDVRFALDMPNGASEVLGFSRDMIYRDRRMHPMVTAFNRDNETAGDEFAPMMLRLSDQGILKELLEMARVAGVVIVGIFVLAMSLVLWNAGLMNGIRRYGEIGIRLAVGESKGAVYRAMLIESVCIGIVGSIIGTAAGLIGAYWLQYHGIDLGNMMQKSTVLLSSVLRAQVTPASFFIGFLPGLFASVIGTMFAGIGIYRRQTSQLFKELEA